MMHVLYLDHTNIMPSIHTILKGHGELGILWPGGGHSLISGGGTDYFPP